MFTVSDTNPEFDAPDGESVELAYGLNPGGDLDPLPETSDAPTVDVRILQTPSMYRVELAVTPTGHSSPAVRKGLSPYGARTLAKRLSDGEAASLREKLGTDQTPIVIDHLETAAAVAGTLAIGETIGHDVIQSFKDGKITAEEFAHEFSRNIDRILENTEYDY